jgi:hypothetical protein
VVEPKIICRHLVAKKNGADLPVLFRYESWEPFAVALKFPTAKGKPTWWISRDLLFAGLRHDAGEGDVLVHPDDNSIDLTLRSPSGAATLTFDTYELLDALRATETVVPLGAEPFDFDAEIARLGVPS